MKGISRLLIVGIFFIQYSYATVLEDVVPTLEFDNHYVEKRDVVTDQHLAVSVEGYKFPEGKQKEKFEKALSLLEDVLNREDFKQMVLSYKNSSGKREYQKNYLWKNSQNKLTNEDVYNIIMTANERMVPGTEGKMNFYARIRRCGWFKRTVSIWCRKVIGSTAPDKSPWMTLNWKFYKNYEPHQMVANIVHEWIHLLGFLHGKLNMREEVPYVVGAIAGKVAKRIINQQNE